MSILNHPVVKNKELRKDWSLNYMKELGIEDPEEYFNEAPSYYTCKDPQGRTYYIPLHLMLRMRVNQKIQGNEPNLNVFKDNIYADKKELGFNFSDTEEGYINWLNFVADYRVYT